MSPEACSPCCRPPAKVLKSSPVAPIFFLHVVVLYTAAFLSHQSQHPRVPSTTSFNLSCTRFIPPFTALQDETVRFPLQTASCNPQLTILHLIRKKIGHVESAFSFSSSAFPTHHMYVIKQPRVCQIPVLSGQDFQLMCLMLLFQDSLLFFFAEEAAKFSSSAYWSCHQLITRPCVEEITL